MDRDWFLVGFIGTAFGTVFFLHEILLRDLGPITVAFGRVSLGALASWAFVLSTGKDWRFPSNKLVLFALAGVFTFVMPFLAFPTAQQYVGAGMAGIVNATTPAFTVLVSQIWPGGERINSYKVFGVIAGVLGIFVLTLPVLQTNEGNQLTGILILLIAPMSFAVAFNLARYIYVVHPSVLATWAFTFGAIVMFPVLLWGEGLPGGIGPDVWVSILIAGVLLTALPFQIAYNILPRAGAMKVASLTYIAPVAALLLGAIFLGERLQPVHFLGVAVIFAGLFLIDRGRLVEQKLN